MPRGRGPEPHHVHCSYRSIGESTLQQKTTAKIIATLPELDHVLDRLAPIRKRASSKPPEYRRTSEPYRPHSR